MPARALHSHPTIQIMYSCSARSRRALPGCALPEQLILDMMTGLNDT